MKTNLAGEYDKYCDIFINENVIDISPYVAQSHVFAACKKYCLSLAGIHYLSVTYYLPPTVHHPVYHHLINALRFNIRKTNTVTFMHKHNLDL